jgi:hypothetical protein
MLLNINHNKKYFKIWHEVSTVVKMCTLVPCGLLNCVVMWVLTSIPPSAQRHNTEDHNPHFQMKVTNLNEQCFMS